jgi:hypothetical protein
MSIRMHAKDLPEDGLIIIKPSDPMFEARLAEYMKGQANSTVDLFKPFSVFLENRSRKAIVAYLVQWCFTKGGGTNDCYRKAYASPRALMEGEDLPADVDARTGKVKPGSRSFLSLISPEGGGGLRVSASRDEVEKFKQGLEPNREELVSRFSLELAQYSDLTVSLDGAFFEDGTFVGDDVSGFFAQMKAQVDAKRDVLNELSVESAKARVSKDQVFATLQSIASQDVFDLNSNSPPSDYYNYYRKHYAKQILTMRQSIGDDRALAIALRPTRKAWRTLAKKSDSRNIK